MQSDVNESIYSYVLFSLGSNIGNRRKNIADAASLIHETGILEDMIVSSCFESEPVGYLDQPWFLNAAASGRTKLDLYSLMQQVKNIEYALGRIGRQRWHEREIDIDILLYGNMVNSETKITIPHPRMHERKFVLIPAAEIAGDVVHPVLGITIKEMLKICTDKSIVRFNIAS